MMEMHGTVPNTRIMEDHSWTQTRQWSALISKTKASILAIRPLLSKFGEQEVLTQEATGTMQQVEEMFQSKLALASSQATLIVPHLLKPILWVWKLKEEPNSKEPPSIQSIQNLSLQPLRLA